MFILNNVDIKMFKYTIKQDCKMVVIVLNEKVRKSDTDNESRNESRVPAFIDNFKNTN